MTERNTRVHGSQIASDTVDPTDIKATNDSPSNGMVPSFNQAQGQFTWVPPVLGDGTSNPTNLLSNGDFENWSGGLTTAIANQSQTTYEAADYRELGRVGGGDTAYKLAQSFQIQSACVITGVALMRFGITGTPSGNWVITIETNNAGSPSGTLANAAATVTVTPISSNGTAGTFNFAVPFSLAKDTTYWLVVSCDAQTANNFWKISNKTGDSAYSLGTAKQYYNSSWSAGGQDDLYFVVYSQAWNAPDGWTLAGAGASVARENSIIKVGTYSAKLTRSGASTYLYVLSVSSSKGIAYWRGRTITCGCWVYATVASRACVEIADATGPTDSSYHTGDSTWQWLTVTRTIDAADAGPIQVLLRIDGGDTTAYFDGAMCVEGSSIFAFAPKPAEEGIYAHYETVSTLVGWSSFYAKDILVKKVGNLVFVSYYIYGVSNSATTSFTLPYTASALNDLYIPIAYVINNSVADGAGLCIIGKDQAGVACYRANGASFGTANNKLISGQFCYEAKS